MKAPLTRSPRKPQLVPPSPASGPPVHPFDLEHGTETGGLIPAEKLLTGHASDKHVTAYYGIAPSILRSLLDLWLARTAPPSPIDLYTFLDIGAGKARAMLVAAESPFHEVVGVELNPELARIAGNNIAIALNHDREAQQLLAPLRLVPCDALNLDLPQTPTLALLFHPFEAPLLRRLLRRFEAGFAQRPGNLDILYVNAEHASVFEHHPAFRQLWKGAVAMSTEDHIADLREIAEQAEYGSTGDEQCAIYRYEGRRRSTPA
ncbi:MAG: hypothetical protein NVSMB3_11620 [Acidobacteriaceae bacterium]